MFVTMLSFFVKLCALALVTAILLLFTSLFIKALKILIKQIGGGFKNGK